MSKQNKYVVSVDKLGFPISEPKAYIPRKGRMPNEAFIDTLDVTGLRYVNGKWEEFTGEKPTLVTPEPPQETLTVLQLRRLFTFAEKVTIEEAIANGNPPLKVFMDDLAAATEVDLTDPLVEQGLNILIASEIISEERKQQILANETPDEELP